MFKGVLIAKLLKTLKAFKVFGFIIKFNNFRLNMKNRKQYQKCHDIACQICRLDHTDPDIQRKLCECRDILYEVAHKFNNMEDN